MSKQANPIIEPLQETLKDRVLNKLQSTLENYDISFVNFKAPFTFNERYNAWGTEMRVSPSFNRDEFAHIMEDVTIPQLYGVFSPTELTKTSNSIQSTHTVLFYMQYDNEGRPIANNSHRVLSSRYSRELTYTGKIALEIAKDAPSEISFDFERTFFDRRTGKADEEFVKILLNIDLNSQTRSIQTQILEGVRDYINNFSNHYGVTRLEPLHTFIAHILMVAYSHVPRLKNGEMYEEPNGISVLTQMLKNHYYDDSMGLINFLKLLESMRITGTQDETEFIQNREHDFILHSFRKQAIFLEKRENTFLTYEPRSWELGDIVELVFYTQEEWNDSADDI